MFVFYGGNMRRLLIGIVLIFIISTCAWAQTEFPKAEVFTGYSFFRAEPEGYNLNGWNVSVTGNFTSWFGLEGDFSGHYGKPKEDGYVIQGVNLNSHSILAGPKITARTDYVSPFVHFLIGINRAGSNEYGKRYSDFSLATVIGGGFDISLNKNVAIRAFQLDYLMTRYDLNKNGIDDRQNNFRFSTGIVIKVGNN
jgi:hypothetical protein